MVTFVLPLKLPNGHASCYDAFAFPEEKKYRIEKNLTASQRLVRPAITVIRPQHLTLLLL